MMLLPSHVRLWISWYEQLCHRANPRGKKKKVKKGRDKKNQKGQRGNRPSPEGGLARQPIKCVMDIHASKVKSTNKTKGEFSKAEKNNGKEVVFISNSLYSSSSAPRTKRKKGGGTDY